MMGKETYLQAVERVLKGWQALRMAVDNSFGGSDSVEKAEWMVEVTGQFIWDNWPVSVEEVEDYVGTIMDQEFDTMLEDGSLTQISKQLCDLRLVCLDGSPTAVENYFSQNLKTASSSQTVPNPPDTSGCVEAMEKLKFEEGQSKDCEQLAEGSEGKGEECVDKEGGAVVDDGWTVVAKGKQKQR